MATTPKDDHALRRRQEEGGEVGALRSRAAKHPDVSTGPFARSFARLLAPLTHLLRQARFTCTLRCAHSFARSLTR